MEWDEERAFQFIQDLIAIRNSQLFQNQQISLNSNHMYVFKRTWKGESYAYIRTHYPIQCQLKQLHNTGSDLWRILTQLLGTRVQASNLHVKVYEAYRNNQQQEAFLDLEEDQEEMPLSNSQNPHPSSNSGGEAGSEHGVLSPETSSTNHQYFFLKRIVLIVEEPEDITKENLSRELRIQPVTEFRIQPITSSLWEMLGLIDDLSGGSWEDLVSKLPLENRRWSEQLLETIYQAIRRREIPQEIQLPFRSSDGRLFRPSLDAINTLNGSKQFIFILLPVPSEGWVYNPLLLL